MSFERRCSARFSFFRSPTKTRSGAVSFAPPSNNNKKQSVTRDCSPINVATGEEKKTTTTGMRVTGKRRFTYSLQGFTTAGCVFIRVKRRGRHKSLNRARSEKFDRTSFNTTHRTIYAADVPVVIHGSYLETRPTPTRHRLSLVPPPPPSRLLGGGGGGGGGVACQRTPKPRARERDQGGPASRKRREARL